MKPNCCQDHQCDYCPKCLSGRCCRNDNPHYKLPKLGDWGGMTHGKLGALIQIDGKAECHCCGETFGHLGAHISRAHDLTPQEYKAIFGLNASTALIGEDLAEKRRENTAHLEQYVEICAEKLRSFTPEQRKYHKQISGTRLEQKLDPAYLERRRSASQKGREAQLAKFEANHPIINCPVCKKEFRPNAHKNKSKIKYCSQTCYLECPIRRKRGAKVCRAHSIKTKGKPPKYVHRCPTCDKLFRSRRDNAIYCNRLCQQQDPKTIERLRNQSKDANMIRNAKSQSGRKKSLD